jgi:hypothetical protein
MSYLNGLTHQLGIIGDNPAKPFKYDIGKCSGLICAVNCECQMSVNLGIVGWGVGDKKQNDVMD